MHKEECEKAEAAGKPWPELAFCECRKSHIVGIIKDQRYYLTDIS